MKEEKLRKSIERGNELLLPFGVEVSDVASLELSTEKFRNQATASQWARNHGFKPAAMTTKVRTIDVAVRPEDRFEPGTLRLEKVNRTVSVWVGEPIEKGEPEAAPETPTAPTDREVRRRSELVEIAKAEGDPEESVRMIGIVSKPEDPDAEGTVISAEEIERANFEFMKSFGTIGFMHQTDISEKVALIQNVIAPVDIDFPLPNGETKKIVKGTWYQELYSEDAEIVKGVRGGTITGLSIGGVAEVEEFDEPVAMVAKRAPFDVAKGDLATNRFHHLRVHEVSLVDAAANEEEWLFIKRRKDAMSKPEETAVASAAGNAPETDNPESTPEVAPEATPEPAPEVSTEEVDRAVDAPEADAPEGEPSIAEQIAAGVEQGVKAALEAVEKGKPAPATPEPAPAPETEVSKGIGDVLEKLGSIEKRLDEQDKRIDEAASVRATAKGASVPSETTKSKESDGESASPWAGTAVHAVTRRGR